MITYDLKTFCAYPAQLEKELAALESHILDTKKLMESEDFKKLPPLEQELVTMHMELIVKDRDFYQMRVALAERREAKNAQKAAQAAQTQQ